MVEEVEHVHEPEKRLLLRHPLLPQSPMFDIQIEHVESSINLITHVHDSSLYSLTPHKCPAALTTLRLRRRNS